MLGSYVAYPCGHVFRGSKPLTTRNEEVMLVQQALETEEQTAKHKKTDSA